MDLETDKNGVDAMLGIIAAADEACAGLGFWKGASLPIEHVGLSLLDERRSLCWEVAPSRAIVFPKMHNPFDGLTLRSLTHNLALWTNTEVAPSWRSVDLDSVDFGMNVLLLPWPLSVEPSAFRESTTVKAAPPESGYFEYNAPLFPSIEHVRRVVLRAEEIVGRIQAIVLPELSLRLEDFELVRHEFPQLFVIAGIGTSPADGSFGRNEVAVSAPLWRLPEVQSKHHRWRLDDTQIAAYGLGPDFAACASWWEAIEVRSRECTFYNFNEWLTLNVLICEDLARQDPVAELIRSVGPNLLITLLLDGPQLKDRWSARYATVLAEDPRTSVLTLTCAGMVGLSNSQRNGSASRNVALWRDAVKRETREIALASGAEGIVLSLGSVMKTERTADGRSDQCGTGYVTLQGVHQVILGPKASER